MGLLRWVSNRGWVVVVVRFQIGSSDDFFLLAWVCVCLCLCLRESEKKKNGWKAQENGIMPRQYRIERNNKERLNNNILIKIEFLDVGGIVKWYGITV